MPRLMLLLAGISTASYWHTPELRAQPASADTQVGFDKSAAHEGMSPYERHYAGDRFVGVFREDSNAWVYTAEFASRFGMPKRWISEDLRGALALAFRYEILSERMCGYSGDKNTCLPIEQCILEVYVDHSTDLGWVTENERMSMIQMDSSVGSTNYLFPSSGSDRKRMVELRKSGPGVSEWLEVGHYGPLNGKLGYGLRPIEFHRNVFDGVDWLRYRECMDFVKTPEAVRIQYATIVCDGQCVTRPVRHTIDIPSDFVARAANLKSQAKQDGGLWSIVKDRLSKPK